MELSIITYILLPLPPFLQVHNSLSQTSIVPDRATCIFQSLKQVHPAASANVFKKKKKVHPAQTNTTN